MKNNLIPPGFHFRDFMIEVISYILHYFKSTIDVLQAESIMPP